MKLRDIMTAALLTTLGLVVPLNIVKNPRGEASAQPVVTTPLVWQQLTSNRGQFTVRMPGKAESQTLTRKIIGKPINWNLLSVKNGSEDYVVAYTDLSRENLEQGSKAFLNNIKNDVLIGLNLQTLGDRGRIISLESNPGREFLGIKDGEIVALRLYLVQQRLYGLFSRSRDLAHVSQFFNSFQLQSPWQPFASRAGKFVVQVPMVPSEEKDTNQIQGKQFNWNVFEARNFYAPSDLYAVAYTDLSSDLLQQESGPLFSEVSKNILTELNLQTLGNSGKDISLDGNPGRAFIGTQSGRIVAIRLYLVGQRLYGIFARSEEVTDVERFLNSFRVQ